MFHFWFYVAASYFDGIGAASLANLAHETPISGGTLFGLGNVLASINPLFICDGNGPLQQGYNLDMQGVELGYDPSCGAHKAIVPLVCSLKSSEVGDRLRTNLGKKKQ